MHNSQLPVFLSHDTVTVKRIYFLTSMVVSREYQLYLQVPLHCLNFVRKMVNIFPLHHITTHQLLKGMRCNKNNMSIPGNVDLHDISSIRFKISPGVYASSGGSRISQRLVHLLQRGVCVLQPIIWQSFYRKLYENERTSTGVGKGKVSHAADQVFSTKTVCQIT